MRAAKNTGRNVEINATTSAIPTIIPTDTIPNTNSVTCKFISDFKIELISPQPKNAPISASTVHIPTIIPASAKKILNTSVPLAPTARKIPISLRLFEIDIEIKLNIKSAENTANTCPTPRKTIESVEAISFAVEMELYSEQFSLYYTSFALLFSEPTVSSNSSIAEALLS